MVLESSSQVTVIPAAANETVQNCLLGDLMASSAACRPRTLGNCTSTVNSRSSTSWESILLAASDPGARDHNLAIWRAPRGGRWSLQFQNAIQM
jgi:hypothetical protein